MDKWPYYSGFLDVSASFTCLDFVVWGKRALLAREIFKITGLLEILSLENTWRNFHASHTC